MSYTVVIPARYGSTRLPGKPLLEMRGKPMIQLVWEQASATKADRVVVATDDSRILEAGQTLGAEVCMTSAEHRSGTDRLQQVVEMLGLPMDHIVVNVQGDEPLIPPQVIDQVAVNLGNNSQAGIATLCEEISTVEDLNNPNVVKVVRDAQGMAMYFSRAPIPWPRDTSLKEQGPLPERGQWHRHIGIYAYRTQFLHQFINWSPAPQEQLESLEQLRALHNGTGIHVDVACQSVPGGIDTEKDLALVRRLIAGES